MSSKSRLLLLFLALILMAGCSTLNGPAENFLSKLEAGELEEAKVIYDEKIKDNEEEDTKLHSMLIERAEQTYNDYIGNDLEYSKAIENIDILKKSNLELKNIESYKGKINNIEKSRSNLSEGSNLIKEGRYLEGIEALNNVIEDDTENYSDARKLIEDNRLNLEEYIINMTSNKNTEESIDYLNENSKYEIDNRISNKIDELIKNNTEEKLVTLDQMITVKDYEGALELIKKNTSYLDPEIIKNKTTEIKDLQNKHFQARLNDIKSRVTVFYDSVGRSHTIVAKGYSTRYINISKSVNIEPRISVDSSVNLLMILGFTQDDWIFFDRVIFAIDGYRKTLELDYGDRQTDVGWGNISEWTSIAHSDYDFSSLGVNLNRIGNYSDLIDKIIKSKEATIRFQGNGYRDHIISNKEKQTIADMWELYDILSNNSLLKSEFLN